MLVGAAAEVAFEPAVKVGGVTPYVIKALDLNEYEYEGQLEVPQIAAASETSFRPVKIYSHEGETKVSLGVGSDISFRPTFYHEGRTGFVLKPMSEARVLRLWTHIPVLGEPGYGLGIGASETAYIDALMEQRKREDEELLALIAA
jgi:hypothetical protein